MVNITVPCSGVKVWFRTRLTQTGLMVQFRVQEIGGTGLYCKSGSEFGKPQTLCEHVRTELPLMSSDINNDFDNDSKNSVLDF